MKKAKPNQGRRDAGRGPAREADARRLVHELQVHQLELEMQNEELVQSRAEVEAGLRQYTDLYDFAPVGYFTVGPDGAIRRVNLAGARLVGVERGRLLDRRFALFLSAESRPLFQAFLKKVLETRGTETCDVALARSGAKPLWAHIEATRSANGQDCLAAVMDISERKQAQEALRHLSIHDALTGLYNRGFFEEQMARLERGRDFPVSLLIADVDQLKDVNDRQGHVAGDAILKRVGEVLTIAFRTEDVIARIGGDEFGILLPGTDTAAAEVAVLRVRQVLEEHNASDPGPPIRISFGVSTARARMPLADLLREADADMYRDKRGRGPEPRSLEAGWPWTGPPRGGA